LLFLLLMCAVLPIFFGVCCGACKWFRSWRHQAKV
jgi:hypothetical protein